MLCLFLIPAIALAKFFPAEISSTLTPLSIQHCVCSLQPPTPSVGMLATLLLVCTLLKITVINGELQQLVEPP